MALKEPDKLVTYTVEFPAELVDRIQRAYAHLRSYQGPESQLSEFVQAAIIDEILEKVRAAESEIATHAENQRVKRESRELAEELADKRLVKIRSS